MSDKSESDSVAAADAARSREEKAEELLQWIDASPGDCPAVVRMNWSQGVARIANALRSAEARGVREGLERAARIEKAARLLVGTYIRATDPSWCGCCASDIGEGGGHKGDCEAAFMLRSLAAQEGREQP